MSNNDCPAITFSTDHTYTTTAGTARVSAITTVSGQGILVVSGLNPTQGNTIGSSTAFLKELYLNTSGGTFTSTGNIYANTLRITNTTPTFSSGTFSFGSMALSTGNPFFQNATLSLTGDLTTGGVIYLQVTAGNTTTATFGSSSALANWNVGAVLITAGAGDINTSLAGNLSGLNDFQFAAGAAGTRSLDLSQYRATVTSGGGSLTMSTAGILRSTITSATGQTTCVGGNTAGCISSNTATIPAQTLVQLTVASGIRPAVGTRYTIVDAAPGNAGVATLTAGNITSLTSGYTFGQFASTEDLIMEVLTAPAAFSSNPSASVGVTGGVATVLSQTSGLSSSLNTIVNTISGYSSEAQTNALRRLVPMTSTAGFSAVRRAGFATFDTIGSRLSGLRDAGLFAYENGFAEGKVLLAAAGSVSGIFPPSAAPHNGAWVRLMGGRADQNAYDGYSGYGARSRGLTVGFDHRLESDAVVGIAGSYIGTDVSYSDVLSGNRNDVRNGQITAYVGQDFGNFTLDGQFAYARQRYDSRRDTVLSGIAKGDYNGSLTGVRVSAGRPIALGNSTLTPLASLDWTRLSQDGYSESGAGAANLTVQSASSTRVRSGLGARLSGEIESGDYKIRPMAHLIWYHDFKKSGTDMTGSLEGGGGSFLTPGQELKRDAANLGLGLMISTGKHSSISVKLEGERASGYSGHNAEAVANWRF